MRYKKRWGGDRPATVRQGEDATEFVALERSNRAEFWVEFSIALKPEQSYVLLPACAYDGNRFDAVPRRYPPFYLEAEFGADTRPRMTQVPRLSPDGESMMEVTTGDLSVPCVAVLDKRADEAMILFTRQATLGRNLGITLREHAGQLSIRLEAPAHRSLCYFWKGGFPSLNRPPEDADPPMAVEPGDVVRVEHLIDCFPCDSIEALYRRFFALRDAMYTGAEHASLPFSEAWRIAERKYNACNYDEQGRFYTVGVGSPGQPNRFNRWQAGWVGGGMSSLPLMYLGCELSRARALNTLWFARTYQSEYGLFYGIVADDGIHHDCFGMYEEKHNALLIRKHADLSYFFFKHFAAMDKMGMSVPDELVDCARRACDAMLHIFDRYGQLGQFVNCETGEILVGGSSSGGIASAALALAYERLDDRKYLDAAAALGKLYRTHIAAGVTTGGPGEILSAPDSESVAGILESFVTLYDVTQQEYWLDAAQAAAHQLTSWVVPYDYDFPEGSEFHRLSVKTAGSVFANVQNKHSAPGICTLSAAAYLKLYRATGDEIYLREMRRISRFIVQTMSYPGHEIYASDGSRQPDGYICERVNMSDWEGRAMVGGLFPGSCWCEVSQMLTWLEIPGVYVDRSNGLVYASDHVSAQWLEDGRLEIRNTTRFDATVKLLVEDETARCMPLGVFWADRFQQIKVDAGQTAIVDLN